MAVRVGVQIRGWQEAQKMINDIGLRANQWAQSRIGVEVRVPYAYWIEHGKYFSGRPGRIRRGGYYYARDARAEVLPSIGPKMAKSLLPGGDPSQAAADISGQLQRAMQARQPVVSGRLRGSTVVFRGGGIRGL
jgi:hypothetical protein